jgi:light-regulated signal transduction histidine kinase (bacteriophytochrome)
VTVTVQDNGIGIEKRHFEQVFTIFQRLHSRERYAGNGIGLPLVRKIVERHGGQVTLDSVPGEGTRVAFTLRAAADDPGSD